MANRKGEVCDFCRKGHVIWRLEEMSFRQSSDKGYVHCRVTLEVAICDTCGTRSLDASAEKIFDEAFQREYDRLK